MTVENKSSVKVLFFGDLVGKSARIAVRNFLVNVKNDYDFVIVNGENASHGFGLTKKNYQNLFYPEYKLLIHIDSIFKEEVIPCVSFIHNFIEIGKENDKSINDLKSKITTLEQENKKKTKIIINTILALLILLAPWTITL